MRTLALAALLATPLAGCVTAQSPVAPAPLAASSAQAPFVPPAVTMPSAPLPTSLATARIAFGSCNRQGDDQSFWGAVAKADPDLFVYLGDNVYGDVRTDDPSLPELRAAYYALAASDDFAAFREAVPVLPVWDDHDYGLNDAGRDFPLKAASEALFEDVWALPADDPRRAHEGVYGAVTVGEPGQRVQLVLLDTRTFRSGLTPTDERGAPGRERYVPSAAAGQTMLGTAQEAWLAETLTEPADLRVLVTSVQLIADGHGWEAWATLPDARRRLYDLIEASGARNIVVVSGDRHAGGFYETAAGGGLTEMTASSLNAPASAYGPERYEEAGPNRLGPMVREANFGLVEVDWATRTATMTLRDMAGGTYQSVSVPFGEGATAGF